MRNNDDINLGAGESLFEKSNASEENKQATPFIGNLSMSDFEREAYMIMLLSGRTEEAEQFRAKCEEKKNS